MIDTSNWKEFQVKDIFSCSTCPSSIKAELPEGDTPYVSRTALNNGQDGYVDVDDDKITNGNCITIGAEGIYAFYQKDDFATGVKIYTLRNENLNRRTGLFLCTVLNLEYFKYNYGRARILSKIKNEIIKLPADEEGNPDWNYMEEYIKSLEDKEKMCIKTLLKID